MVYKPITDEDKEAWIKFLKSQAEILDGQPEGKNNAIFKTDSGDVGNAKDLVGNLLALLTNENVEIK